MIYHKEFLPLEWAFYNETSQTAFLKVIVHTSDNNRVIGYHILSPNAGEVTQGIAIAIKCGLTKEQLDDSVGIHPTVAEESTTMKKIKGKDSALKALC